MLLSLTLQNIAVIRQMELQLEPTGLTAITGETGAGKSLLLDAIQLLFDKKLSAKNYLSHGASAGRIESVWRVLSIHSSDSLYPTPLPPSQREGGDSFIGASLTPSALAQPQTPISTLQTILNEEGLEINILEEPTLILSREVTPTASRCRINGYLTNMDVMARIGSLFIEMHGQHDLHRLFSASAQRDMLDNYGGAPVLTVRENVKTSYRTWQKLEAEREALLQEHAKLMQERDFLAFQLAELDDANLEDPQEDTALESERLRLSNVDNLKKAVQDAQRLLVNDDTNARELIQTAQKSLSRLSDDTELASIKEQLDTAEAIIADASASLDRLTEQTSQDPERLQQIVERQDLLARLKRKYGGTQMTLEVVMATHTKLHQQFEALQNIQQFTQDLEANCKKSHEQYLQQADVLRDLRQKLIPKLSEGVQKELCDLNLENARFDITMTPLASPQEAGLDQIQMMFSANPGIPLQPLDSVASGGELARVMLALRLQDVSASQSQPVLIFDEIDAGLSGEALKKLAEKLQNVAKSTQVIVVTHQPLLAGAAQHHWHLIKTLDETSQTEHRDSECDSMTVSTHAFLLANAQNRKLVLAQMASGELSGNSAVAQKFAASLLAG